jgi:hypothetical protein
MLKRESLTKDISLPCREKLLDSDLPSRLDPHCGKKFPARRRAPQHPKKIEKYVGLSWLKSLFLNGSATSTATDSVSGEGSRLLRYIGPSIATHYFSGGNVVNLSKMFIRLYLSIPPKGFIGSDLEHPRLCPLPLPGVPQAFLSITIGREAPIQGLFGCAG